jgi:hypothetical protein
VAAVQYTFTHKQHTEQQNIGTLRSVPRLCELYPDICLTTEGKARKNLSQGSRRVPVGTVKTEYTEQSIITIRIHKHNNNYNYILI